MNGGRTAIKGRFWWHLWSVWFSLYADGTRTDGCINVSCAPAIEYSMHICEKCIYMYTNTHNQASKEGMTCRCRELVVSRSLLVRWITCFPVILFASCLTTSVLLHADDEAVYLSVQLSVYLAVVPYRPSARIEPATSKTQSEHHYAVLLGLLHSATAWGKEIDV